MHSMYKTFYFLRNTMTHQRLYKAMNQRILMVGEDVDVNECKGMYKILGNSGKQYKVCISSDENTCTCPDHSMRLVDCKHILFVLIQVLGFNRDNIRSHRQLLKEAFEKRAVLNTVHNGSIDVNSMEEKKNDKRKQIEGADCPICLELLETGETIVYCKKTCGNNFHEYCFLKWKHANKGDATCPMCRGWWK